MTLEEFKSTYAGAPAREVLALIESNPEFRSNLEALYVETFHKALHRSCPNCWFDAYVLLMKTETQKIIIMKESQFELKAGALLIDLQGRDDSKTASHHNLTDELALYHLSRNPSYASLFSRLPEDWEKQAVEYGARELREAEKAAVAGDKAPAGSGAPEGDKNADNTPKTPEELKAAAVAAAEESLKKAKANLKGAETRLAKAKAADPADAEKVAKAQASYDKAAEGVAAAEKTLADAQAIEVPEPEEKPKGAEETE